MLSAQRLRSSPSKSTVPPCATYTGAVYESDHKFSSRPAPANPLSRAHNLGYSPPMVNRARVSWSVILSVCALVSRVRAAKLSMIGNRELLKHLLWHNVGAQRRGTTSSSVSSGTPSRTHYCPLRPIRLVTEICRGRLNPAHFIRGSTSAGLPPQDVSEEGRVNLLISILI